MDDLCDAVPVRDSKDPCVPVRLFPMDGWAVFVTAIKTEGLSVRPDSSAVRELPGAHAGGLGTNRPNLVTGNIRRRESKPYARAARSE
ncbi:DUF397 domain-containing protein [Streptomyces beijiangensis]|uniref:DUF397 domain-containing protein n=1 Tax=Streptomyces beijiangensis TaxID=163361 RepID=A0A939F3T2_9ACTN|nr:DUF397 domain-containing protein [Streptomyces beijiangensis]